MLFETEGWKHINSVNQTKAVVNINLFKNF